MIQTSFHVLVDAVGPEEYFSQCGICGAHVCGCVPCDCPCPIEFDNDHDRLTFNQLVAEDQQRMDAALAVIEATL